METNKIEPGPLPPGMIDEVLDNWQSALKWYEKLWENKESCSDYFRALAISIVSPTSLTKLMQEDDDLAHNVAKLFHLAFSQASVMYNQKHYGSRSSDDVPTRKQDSNSNQQPSSEAGLENPPPTPTCSSQQSWLSRLRQKLRP